MGDIGIDWRDNFKADYSLRIVQKSDSSGSIYRQMVVSCEHSNEVTGYIKFDESLVLLRNC